MTKVTMGSKREEGTQVQEQQSQKDASLTQETSSSSNRASTGQTTVADRPATKKRLRADRPTSGYWYLQDSDELQGVTAEAFNDDLGIKEIRVFEPSDAQWNNGTVARVTLVTIIGEITGIQVIDSNRDDSIYVRMQSRSYERDGSTQYVNDIKLARKVEAQILRYIDSLLVNA